MFRANTIPLGSYLSCPPGGIVWKGGTPVSAYATTTISKTTITLRTREMSKTTITPGPGVETPGFRGCDLNTSVSARGRKRRLVGVNVSKAVDDSGDRDCALDGCDFPIYAPNC